jgi:hypothetical protein
MVENGFMWIYLVFLLVPLSRIVPRLLKKWKSKNSDISQQLPNDQFQFSNNTISESAREPPVARTQSESKPASIDMLVLGEINHGTKFFNSIQNKLGIDTDSLNSVLEDLENHGLIRVEQKQGLFGSKIELHVTDKGLKKFYS